MSSNLFRTWMKSLVKKLAVDGSRPRRGLRDTAKRKNHPTLEMLESRITRDQRVVDVHRVLAIRAHIVQEAIQMQTIISLVSAGMGIALVPASLRHLARTGVRYLDLQEGAPTLETGLVWRRGDTTPTLERFLEVATKAT